jgi:hypothetical protein
MTSLNEAYGGGMCGDGFTTIKNTREAARFKRVWASMNHDQRMEYASLINQFQKDKIIDENETFSSKVIGFIEKYFCCCCFDR